MKDLQANEKLVFFTYKRAGIIKEEHHRVNHVYLVVQKMAHIGDSKWLLCKAFSCVHIPQESLPSPSLWCEREHHLLPSS